MGRSRWVGWRTEAGRVGGRVHECDGWMVGRVTGGMDGWAAAVTHAANEQPCGAMRCDAARAALPHRSIVGASARLRIDAPCTTSCRRNAQWLMAHRRRRATRTNRTRHRQSKQQQNTTATNKTPTNKPAPSKPATCEQNGRDWRLDDVRRWPHRHQYGGARLLRTRTSAGCTVRESARQTSTRAAKACTSGSNRVIALASPLQRVATECNALQQSTTRCNRHRLCAIAYARVQASAARSRAYSALQSCRVNMLPRRVGHHAVRDTHRSRAHNGCGATAARAARA